MIAYGDHLSSSSSLLLVARLKPFDLLRLYYHLLCGLTGSLLYVVWYGCHPLGTSLALSVQCVHVIL
jgi:hypothetical protein